MPTPDHEDFPTSNAPVLPIAHVGSAGGGTGPGGGGGGYTGELGAAGGSSGGPVSTPTGFALLGKRTDLADGVGIRFQVGFDASTPPVIVVERWSEDGIRTAVTFS